MIYRHLGRTGLRVSAISMGSWVTFSKEGQVQSDLAFNLMKEAYRRGINFFDNAEVYANGQAETIMGEAIQRGINEKVWERSDLVVSTKIFFGAGKTGPNSRGLSRKHIVEGTLASLERMKLSYVDLIFCHRPDPYTPIEETVRAMNHIIDRGLAFYWGTSEWNAQQLTEAVLIAERLHLIPPAFDQPEYNLFARQKVEMDYLPLYERWGLGLTTWSPLASGILSGKYSGGVIPEGARLGLKDYAWLKDIKMNKNAWQFEKADLLKPIAAELGCTMSQLAIAWSVANETVSSTIIGCTSMAQLKENVDSLAFLPKITPQLRARLDAILGTKPEADRIHQQVTGIRALSTAK